MQQACQLQHLGEASAHRHVPHVSVMRYVSKSCCDSKVAAYLLLSTLLSIRSVYGMPAQAPMHPNEALAATGRQQFQCTDKPLQAQSTTAPQDPLHFCTANQTPCQNDAHRNGTCETRLSSPEELASPRKRRGQANMLRAAIT